MNITFLIGNGFDIGLGMPTRFEDFYKEYCRDIDTSPENIQDFKKTLKNWLDAPTNEKKIADWADFEKTFGEHSQDFVTNEKQKYLDRFRDFINSLNLYIEKIEKCIELEDVTQVTKVVNDALKNYKIIRKDDTEEIEVFYRRFGSNRIYNFVTFNYTKTVDSFYNALKTYFKNDNNRKVGSLVHIHGYVEDSMILGVNDSSQILNEDFRNDPEVVEMLVKPYQNTFSRTGYEKAFKTTIDSSNVICVYGMSIGETDKKWWDYISNWLSGHDLRILVILQYNEKYNQRFPYMQSQCTKDVVGRFLNYSSLSNEKKQKISEKIYVGFNNNVFAMNAFNVEKFEKII